MEITTTVTVDINGKATYRNGKLVLSVVAGMPYQTATGERMATGSINEGFSKAVEAKFKQAFDALMAETQDKAVAVAEAARAEAVGAASRQGEL